MFERFTMPARQTVVAAQEVAQELGHPCIGPEHVLYGLAAQEHSASSAALAEQGVTPDLLRRTLAGYLDDSDPLDSDALATLGIDLDAVRRATEASFGPGALDSTVPAGKPKPETTGRSITGHLPFTKDAKKVLELALREALKLGAKEINDGHVLLGLLRGGTGLAGKILAQRGVDVERLRADVTRRMGDAAA
jgi:ATP-dependent Clp protease ATP-binding subunit ClpA